jgi:WD40 repeat protein/serine/threonine protein kinase
MNERELFIAALQKNDAAERQAYIIEACGTDLAMRQRVENLMAVYEKAGSFLEPPAGDTEATIHTASQETPGTIIGPYKLLQQIGEGGMGVVWMAEQTQPVKRKVALKVIKPGMDSRQVIARFEAERQALAMMDHVNIARVLDAGATEAGRPYFVMELVHGVPITRYCDEHHLTPRERLELFVPVCHAVQHAHQKGIIHRDIKPSNVMVTLYDGKPVPKVIDFGVAKATEQKLTEQTLFTAYGALIGTLEYMSPEQAETSALGVDTRSDIYSLGVLLYELLTGSTPLDRKRVKQAAYAEILRMIKEEEPPRPSTRLSNSGEALATISAQRNTESSKLSKMMRGELDWIVMKTLEKDRNRRYETANGFAQDIQRYLNDEPVQACPPTAWYRFQKFARRNKAALATTLAAFLLVLLGGAGLAVSNVLIRQETDAKNEALTAKLIAQEDRTKEEKKRADAENTRAAALDKWRQTAAYLQIALTFNEYRANNLGRAEEMLDGCPADLRKWEWHYLKRLCHSELSSIAVGSPKNVRPRLTALTPGADRLAYVDLNVVHIHDSATGKILFSFPIVGHQPQQLIISRDGKLLATGGIDKGQDAIHVWDAVSGKEIAVLKGLTKLRGFWSLAFSPDAGTVAGADRRGSLFLWDVATGTEQFRVAVHTVPNAKPNDNWNKVAFSPDGKQLVTASDEDGEVKIWHAENGKVVKSLGRGEGFADVAFSPKGTWVAAVGRHANVRVPDLSVRVWDLKTGQVRHVLRGHTGPVLGLAFSPDEKLIATASADTTVRIWDLNTGRENGAYRGHPFGAHSVAFTPDGKRVVVLSGDRVLKTWDATRGPEALKLATRSSVHAAFSPDSRHVAAAASHVTKFDYMAIIWDTATGAELNAFGDKNEMMHQLAYSPDGKFIAAANAGRNDGWVRVWDLAAGKRHRRFPDEKLGVIGPCFTVAYSPDGTLLAAGGADRLVHVWETATGAERFTLTGHPRTLSGLAFSRDGSRLASATGGITWNADFSGKDPLKLKSDNEQGPSDVKVWDTRTGKELLSLALPPRPQGLALSPDGRLVAVTATDKTVRLYDVGTGKEVLVLKGHSHPPWAVAFSPDGTRVVTGGGFDESVRLWDAKTGEEILTLACSQMVSGVAFSPDGHKIVAVSQVDDVVFVWDATPLKK